MKVYATDKNLKIACIAIESETDSTYTQAYFWIEHRYMESGHSYMPCDRDFGCLELKLCGLQVYTPAHYITIMEAASNKRPFIVVPMDSTQFFYFDILGGSVSKAKQARDVTLGSFVCTLKSLPLRRAAPGASPMRGSFPHMPGMFRIALLTQPPFAGGTARAIRHGDGNSKAAVQLSVRVVSSTSASTKHFPPRS
ncbi:hypothetical protein O3P69_008648 [Scylla paramamosain]|uniref:Uncharacterized protein n=1 Tax=Scylla paramamosain TaxID=85552 RepID=A0AAW0SMX2_SCYPA